MIVSDDTVSKALIYLSDDPHPLALARKYLTEAETKSKRAWSVSFLNAEGTVDARKALAEISDEYQQARAEEANAILELDRHRQRAKAAEMLIEMWRSEQANVRAAERVR